MNVNLMPHKQALFEIFSGAMDETGLLYQKCDGVLVTSIDRVPSTQAWETFIVLGNFDGYDVITGFNKEKCRIYEQFIHAVAFISSTVLEGEAEYRGDTLARAIRQCLRENQKLTCDSYPSGIALESRLSSSRSEFVQYWESTCSFTTIVLTLKLKEL